MSASGVLVRAGQPVSYSSAAAEAEPRRSERPKTVTGVAALLWDALMLRFVFAAVHGLQMAFGAPFLHTLVSCPPPVPGGGKCPVGAVLEHGQCAPVPRWSVAWSTSAHCHDKGHVMAAGVAWSGDVFLISNVSALLSQIFIGASMLDVLGRKPVVALGLLAMTADVLVRYIASMVPASIAIPLIYSGTAIRGFLDASSPAISAMITDLSGGDLDVRALGYASATGCYSAGILLAFAASLPILSLYLTDYSSVWGFCTVACVIISVGLLAIIHETHGDGQSPAAETSSLCKHDPEASRAAAAAPQGGRLKRHMWAKWSAKATAEIRATWQIVWRDSFLLLALLCACLGVMCSSGSVAIVGGYGIGVVGIRQNIFACAGIVQPLMAMLGCGAASLALGRISDFSTFRLGVLFEAVGLILTALAAEFPVIGHYLFWAGWATAGFGMGMTEPSFAILFSTHTDEHNRGKAFASLALLQSLGRGLGSWIWSHCLFGGDASSGLWAACGFIVSAAGLLCVFATTLPLRRLYQS